MGSKLAKIEDLVLYGDVLELKKELQGLQKPWTEESVPQATGSDNNKNEIGEEREEITKILHQAVVIRDRACQQMQCIVEMLVKAGASVNWRDEAGWTSLHYACAANNAAIVPFLLQQGAQVVRDLRGLYPMDMRPMNISGKHPLGVVVENNALQRELWSAAMHELKKATPTTGFELKLVSSRQMHEWKTPVVIHFSVPPNYSTENDYIQLLHYDEHRSFAEGPHYGKDYPVSKASSNTGETLNEGIVRIETHEIPEKSACHFVYVASNKGRMTRNVVASTGAIWLHVGVSKYTFTVGGIIFYHSSPKLHGREFETAEEVKRFIEQHCNPERKQVPQESSNQQEHFSDLKEQQQDPSKPQHKENEVPQPLVEE